MPDFKVLFSSATEHRVCLILQVPYSTLWSKNKMWRHKGKITYLNRESRSLRDSLAQLIKIKRLPWHPRQRLFVGLIAFRPDMRSDIQNFVDLICDAVSLGTSVGDNYFCGMWDWIKAPKDQAKIFLLISQTRS